MKLKIYGCRGSIPCHSKGDGHFGGNTSCIRLSVGDYSVVLDAGSGLVNCCRDVLDFGEKLAGPQDILLSHLHIDHIIGLCAFAPAFDKKEGIRVFTVSRGETSLASQVFGIFKPPYWPVSLEEATNAQCIPIQVGIPFAAGPLTITPFCASHPDKTTSFHITNGEKSLVYLLDNEVATMDEATYQNLVDYCKGADMVVFDSAYSPDDYPEYKGWGHSTVLDGIKLRRDSNCKRMLFSHFAHRYTDEEILGWKRYFENDFDSNCYIFACDEMEVAL